MPDYFNGKRVLVTGGAGFIGSHLVDALLAADAAHVAVVDTFFLGKEKNLESAYLTGSDRLSVWREDAAEAEALRAVVARVQPDIVYNLATKALLYSFFNPAGAARVNLDIACNLAELLRAEAFDRLIHFSTSEVYGSARQVPMGEDHPLLAETTYAAGKAAADLLLTSYVKMFDLNIGIIRPFNNYGPRQNDGQLAAVIPLSLRRINAGGRPVIEGDGLQTRDFIFVADTVAATLKLGADERLCGKVVNLGSGRETSILDIITTLSDAVGFRGEFEYRPARSADVRRHCADVTLARSMIGEVAPTSLTEGMAATVAWYAGQPS